MNNNFEQASIVLKSFKRPCDVLWISDHGTATLEVGKCVPGTDKLDDGVWPTVRIDRAPYGQPGYVVEVSWASNGANTPEQTAQFIDRLQWANHCAICVQNALESN